MEDMENKKSKKQKNSSSKETSSGHLSVSYSKSGVLVNGTEFPTPTGKYLQKLLELSVYDGTCRQVLSYLINNCANDINISSGSRKQTKELSESMAMVNGVRKLASITNADWFDSGGSYNHNYNYNHNIGSSKATHVDGLLRASPEVTVYVLGDGVAPYTALTMMLFMPARWNFVAIDPIMRWTSHDTLSLLGAEDRESHAQHNGRDNDSGNGNGNGIGIDIVSVSNSEEQEKVELFRQHGSSSWQRSRNLLTVAQKSQDYEITSLYPTPVSRDFSIINSNGNDNSSSNSSSKSSSKSSGDMINNTSSSSDSSNNRDNSNDNSDDTSKSKSKSNRSNYSIVDTLQQPKHSIVLACHSHAPLQEFWDRLPTPKFCVSMPCCGRGWSTLSQTPLLAYEDYEVFSPKRRVLLYHTSE